MINTIKKEASKVVINNSVLSDVTSAYKNRVNVEGLGETREAKLIAPYGIIWLPPIGATAEIIKNWGREKHSVAIGVLMEDKGILPGELLLYSSGGAKIHLKNDGTVMINDRVQIASAGKPITL